MGPPLLDAFRDYAGMTASQAETAVSDYREYFRDKGIFENKVYDGIPELLARLCAAGKKPVLATSKPERFARRILDHFDLAQYFFLAAGATMDSSRSRKGDVIAYALSGCPGAGPATAVMVGDREHDILGAKENHLPSIGVLYGYGSRRELTEAGAGRHRGNRRRSRRSPAPLAPFPFSQQGKPSARPPAVRMVFSLSGILTA